MSDDSEQSGDPSIAGRPVLDIAADWYHVPVIALLIAFMAWVRAQSWQAFVRNGEVFFGGNDPWYHYRSTMYVVRHWPATMPFDPWTQFPTGISVGQFGTLLDQLMATVALLLGLGSPSQHTVAMTVLFTPVVVGALVVIPTYYLGKRLAGRSAGVIAALVLAVLPGMFLQRSLVGTADHNIAEPLFQASAVAVLLVALHVAKRDRPVWEQVRAREWGALKPVLGWSALAGIATALYMWVWPPGVLLVGIAGVFFLLKLASNHYNGRSPDHLASVGATSMSVAGVLLLVPFDTIAFSPSRFSLLQPVAALGVAAACVFLAWLSRTFEARDLDRSLYPLSVLGATVVGAGVVSVVLPDVFSMVASNFMRFVGFDANAAQRTIGEAQPWLGSLSRYGGSRFALFFSSYGLAFFAMLAALAWLLWRPFYDSDSDRERWFAVVAFVGTTVVIAVPGLLPTVAGNVGLPPTLTGLVLVGGLLFASLVLGDHAAEKSLVVVWTLFLIAAAFTQVRFNYYLAVPVAVLSGYAGASVLHSEYVDLGSARDALQDVEATQVVAVVAVLLLLVAPLTMSVTLSTPQGQLQTSTASQVGASASPGSVLAWNPMLQWMQNNTPEEGNLGGTGNADQLEYYGTYQQTSDYDYPDGSYGVMSWWDYGHWITVLGERIPNANPFQGGATYAANYLLAQNETTANQILDSRGDASERTRYVAVDWQMASVTSKFSAPTVFAENVSAYDFYHPLYQGNRSAGYSVRTYAHTQNYYDSMMVRLFRYQGSSMSPSGYVLDWDSTAGDAGQFYVADSSTQVVKQFNSTEEAREYVANDSTSQLGGIGRYPSEYVPALEHYRLVGLSDQAISYQQRLSGSYFQELPYWAKLYERVPGATVQGTGPANTTVTASVTMEATQVGQNFTYTQRAQTGPDGEFTMTLPYSTTGYDEYGPENGYTNVSVRAEGPYQFNAVEGSGMNNQTYWTDTANVSEGQVNGATDTTVQVSLEQLTLQPQTDSGNTSASLSEPSAVTTVASTERAG
ncbi:oligosaccharyl transferase [Halarchaeum grantii]|uniref:dolichyl-phosphooligosaccharide-protein glycotransferase n=1 Tax=Halarchaeum grantii TaxID=1193105 RepID=A0A830EYC0_9EURY|nr:oligosaccharyl transferase, archaeosortase A system-associated [Halarchaeum grantii]GGL22056.1 oligosaccharyl transferase [Halarchaeum grantii]